MARIFALAAFMVFATSVSADEKGWTDKTVKLTVDTKLGTKQAGGLLRDGAALTRGQAFTVKSDDGTFLELVGQSGSIFKTEAEAEVFAGRLMPKKGAPAAKVDPKQLWAAGSKVLPKRSSSQIPFGDCDEDGKSTFYTLTGLSFVVQKDNGDGWIRVRDRYHEGWVLKDDLLTKDTALPHFDKLVKANPQDTWSLFMRAASNVEAGKPDDAIADYTAYLKLVPNSASAINNRGIVWVNKKEYDKAIEDYTAVIKIDPKYSIAYSNRASALLHKKEYEKAIEDCDKAVELDPKYILPAWNRARALAGLKKYDEATKGFEAVLKLEPTDARRNAYAWFLATNPDEKCRDGKRALELAKKVVENGGKDVNWAYRSTLAAACAETGDFEKAVTELQTSMESKVINEPERKKLEARLELYKAKKPYRSDE